MKKNTANKLLDAATPLLAALGWENVTVSQLAEAANLNRAAISYHFGGKEALYQAVYNTSSLRHCRPSAPQTPILPSQPPTGYLPWLLSSQKSNESSLTLFHSGIMKQTAGLPPFRIRS